MNEEIVFFDGVCGLCDSFVQWVAKRDTKRRFAFAPLQGETAKGLLDAEFISKLDGMAYYDGEKTWYKSTAALKIIQKLPKWLVPALWVLFVSLSNRAHAIENGGGAVMRMLLFWSMFLPLNRYYTYDFGFKNSPNKSDVTKICNIATIGFLLQLFLIFFYAGLTKDDAGWWERHDAVYMALQQGNFVKPFGQFIAGNIPLSQFLTKFSLFAELFLPFLFFIPFHNWIFRSIGVLGLAGLVFGFFLSFMIGFFPFVMLIFLFGALPGGLWDFFSKNEGNTTISSPKFGNKDQTLWANVGLGLIIILSWWNNYHNTYNYNAPSLGNETKQIMPVWLEGIINIPRIDQRWWMFTLDSWEDFWLDVEGQYAAGEAIIDPFAWMLNNKDTSFSTERPISVRKNLKTQLWNRYLYDVKDRKVTGEWFLYNLCKKYNEKNPNAKLTTLNLHESKQKILGFNERGPVETQIINTWNCDE